MMKSLLLALIFLSATPLPQEQPIAFPWAAAADDAATSTSMAELARQMIAVYRDSDDDRYRSNLFRIQTIAGQYAEAAATVRSLRDSRQASAALQAAMRLIPFETYATAKARQAASPQLSFAEAFTQSFHDIVGRLDNKTAAQAVSWFVPDLDRAQADLRRALDRQAGKNSIALTDAVGLIYNYHFYRAFSEITSLAATLVAQDDAERYVIDDDALIATPDGAHVAAMVVRPRSATTPLPTLLEFTIYADHDRYLRDARLTAANGYSGVVAYTRGKGRSPDAPVPYEHDGDDARAVIDWISRQPWSDGRVGMYGGSYNGFAQWAAAKHLPPALKALMPPVAAAPGIDVPMEGNVFQSFVYSWPFYAATGHGLDTTALNDRAHWLRLQRNWYVSGRPYRDMDAIDGTPNPIFARWLEHPSYDAYWQRMIPYRDEFAGIDIPVLTTDGYFDGGLVSALYYFNEHHKYNARANHYLVIGPYDHLGSQGAPETFLQGYQIDAVANIDIEELRYQWFNYVLKGGPKPALLKDQVNYEVMGANEWKHAPSLQAMSNGSLRFHLTAEQSGDRRRLSEQKPSRDQFIAQEVDLADRSDVNRPTYQDIVDRTLHTNNEIVFVSDPMPRPVEVSGLFSGQLDFVTNKKDVDINVALYELMPDGRYFQLSYYMVRASYARDRSRRQLLTPGQLQHLTFTSGRLTSRQFQAGSRLVVVLSVIKQPYAQINYGTGKDVSNESMADAKAPLQLKWYGSSYVDIPVWH